MSHKQFQLLMKILIFIAQVMVYKFEVKAMRTMLIEELQKIAGDIDDYDLKQVSNE